MLSYYEEMEDSSKDRDTNQLCNPLEDQCDETRFKLDDQARKRDSPDRTQDTSQIGIAETAKMRPDSSLVLMITIIGFIVTMNVATISSP